MTQSIPTHERVAHAASGLRPFGWVTKRYQEEKLPNRPERRGMPLGPDGSMFYGGRILSVVEIPGYVLVEAERLRADNVPEDTPPEVMWHTYLHDLKCRVHTGEERWGDWAVYSTSHIHRTMEEALVYAIAFRATAEARSVNAAANSQVPTLFWRMVS